MPPSHSDFASDPRKEARYGSFREVVSLWHGPEKHEGSRCGAPRTSRELSARAHKIPLADLHAVVAQDVVGGGGMKVEVRQREVAEKLLAVQGHGLVGTERKADLAGFGTIELRGPEGLHIVHGAG